jgi:ribosomal protein L11 methyltransferase
VRTLILTIHAPDELHELLIAELADIDFTAFEEDDGVVRAYGPAERWSDVRRQQVEQWLLGVGSPFSMEEQIAPDTNWNERWEASIEPLAVGPFLVTPSWKRPSEPPAGQVVLEIDPKMAFGTGYHASTRLALRFLPGLVRGGERVLDAGCGTGILAIAALKLGADRAVGFDIDPWSRVNAEENAERNGLADRLVVREGSTEVVPERDFDLVLANINRNALIEMLPWLTAARRDRGPIVLAGLLSEDRARLATEARAQGLSILDEAIEDEWWSCVLGDA